MKSIALFFILLSVSFLVLAKVPIWNLNAIHAEEAWRLAGSRGKGIRILNIDTGVDPNIPSLKQSIVKAAFFGPGQSVPCDYCDYDSHGTMIAGILTGQSTPEGISGVAPSADLYIAKVNMNGATTPAENQAIFNSVADAVKWGIAESVDIILIEQGAEDEHINGMDLSAENQAIEEAYKKGILIVVPAGNGGFNKVSYPAILPWVISVGEVDIENHRKFGDYGRGLSIVAPGESLRVHVPLGTGRDSRVVINVAGKSEEMESLGFLRSPFVKNLEGSVYFAENGTEEDFSNFPVGNLALVRRTLRGGRLTILNQIESAVHANAKGLLICNHEPLLSSSYLPLNKPEAPIPVVYLDRAPCENLIDLISTGEIASASITIFPSDYATVSGTSASAPHVVGVAALMKSVNPSLRPDDFLNILQSTATKLPSDKNEFGAGLINAARAVEFSKTFKRP